VVVVVSTGIGVLTPPPNAVVAGKPSVTVFTKPTPSPCGSTTRPTPLKENAVPTDVEQEAAFARAEVAVDLSFAQLLGALDSTDVPIAKELRIVIDMLKRIWLKEVDRGH
jgi:hypothetical protein